MGPETPSPSNRTIVSLLLFGAPFSSRAGSYLTIQFLFVGTAGGVPLGVGSAGGGGGNGGGSFEAYDCTRDTCGRGGRLCFGAGSTGSDCVVVAEERLLLWSK